ncbi:MAG: adenosine deaminase [Propionibacteriaceae bacterium]|nr:adenosine deaminase [Propionibacteriaceae bacterium]
MTEGTREPAGRRDLNTLPKAHLHLHFTGSLDARTLRHLADRAGERLPEQLVHDTALSVPATTRGWFRFQRSYDLARRMVSSEPAMRTVVRMAAEHDAAEGARRLELQIDPTSYAPFVGGLAPALEIVLDEARLASHDTGVQIGVIVAASRIRHPIEARTLARLAGRYAGDGPGQVVGFGLSNDEWAGDTPEWEGAFRIAAKAGLRSVPHGGELRGPDHVREVFGFLHPDRLGHGVRTTEDPALLDELVRAGVAFEVCPASNVHLGVYATLADVPLERLLAAGATVALGADDPLLFHARLSDQYRLVRDTHGLDDAALAELARSSIRASFASDADKQEWLSGIDAWLAAPAPL